MSDAKPADRHAVDFVRERLDALLLSEMQMSGVPGIGRRDRHAVAVPGGAPGEFEKVPLGPALVRPEPVDDVKK